MQPHLQPSLYRICRRKALQEERHNVICSISHYGQRHIDCCPWCRRTNAPALSLFSPRRVPSSSPSLLTGEKPLPQSLLFSYRLFLFLQHFYTRCRSAIFHIQHQFPTPTPIDMVGAMPTSLATFTHGAASYKIVSRRNHTRTLPPSCASPLDDDLRRNCCNV